LQVSPKLAAEFAEERKDQRFSNFTTDFLERRRDVSHGDTLKQPECADAETNREKTVRGFYRGETARVIAATWRDSAADSLEDLANYQPKMRETLRCSL